METLTKYSHHGGVRERIKNGFFVLNSVVNHSIELYTSKDLCRNILEIPTKTIDNGINENRSAKRRKNWISFCDGFNVWIRYDSIPLKTKNKRNLPPDSKSMYDRLRVTLNAKEEYFKNQEQLALQSSLEAAYNDSFPVFIKYYSSQFRLLEKQILYSKTHAVFEKVI
jgi:hypothetical protein